MDNKFIEKIQESIYNFKHLFKTEEIDIIIKCSEEEMIRFSKAIEEYYKGQGFLFKHSGEEIPEDWFKTTKATSLLYSGVKLRLEHDGK